MLDSLRRAMPLLTQYQGIMHHHLVGNVATQRTMGKLLSVLLGVFTDLATKVCFVNLVDVE
ncbi:hypothetical protein DPMN_054901 [Dreissena polymorpha]|uniref:Uncharacterized protein n=1 Tax=Dreissena polymorpha TaxID=45954 RepID=A0A9D4HTI8_DREPO|nr:hypothetical protein DPMN_054901 [Dreissena polymorpha]